MALFTVGALTRKGKALIAKSETRNIGIKITKAVTGSGGHPEATAESLERLTELSEPEQTFAISGLDTIEGNTGTAIITVVLHNRGLEKLYYLNELGVYAEDPDDGEILYCVLVSEVDTMYMPPDNTAGDISTITERIYIEVANAEKTTINTTGAVAAAADLETVKKLMNEVRENLKGGSSGQFLRKLNSDDFSYEWVDASTIVRAYKDFPKTGQRDTLYIDPDSTEMYIWRTLSDGTDGYFKLPLGSEASQTLQKQISENLKSINTLKKDVQILEKRFEKWDILVLADEWVETMDDDEVVVYIQEITVPGMTEKTEGDVYPYIHETRAGAVVKEMDAEALFFARGISDSDDGKIVLRCFGKKPKVNFGITFRGALR